jgi:colicin import membrane protein
VRLVREPKYSLPFAASVILHSVVLLILIISFEFSYLMPVVENSDEDMKVISAVIINSQATVPVAAPRPAPTPPKPQPVESVKPAPENVKPTPVVTEKDIEQNDDEEEMLAIGEQLKKQLLEKQVIITKKLIQDKKKKIARQKKLQQAALLHAMEKEMKDSAAKSLQQQLLNEQQRVVGVKVRGEVNKYKALILQAISEQWLVPAGIDKKLSSELLIRVAPGGTVLDVQVMKSSGDLALDRSARDAVFKASPLPVPDDEDGFEQFRQFVLKVKPQNLIASDA